MFVNDLFVVDKTLCQWCDCILNKPKHEWSLPKVLSPLFLFILINNPCRSNAATDSYMFKKTNQ